MYRFHPSVKWTGGYPDRQQIVSQITQLWKRYDLQERTKFNTCKICFRYLISFAGRSRSIV